MTDILSFAEVSVRVSDALQPHQQVRAAMWATRALEAVVDALIKFDIETGRLRAEPGATVRQQYRGVVVQLINERDREHAEVAERAMRDVLSQCHEALAGCNAPDLHDVRLALTAYRSTLQQAPVIRQGTSV
jgi:hypothetical protein